MNGPRIWNFTNADTWELAREPIDSNCGQVDMVLRDKHPGVGPALAMADAFTAKHPGVSVGLIPCGKSGSSIEKWQPDVARFTIRLMSLSAKAGRVAGQTTRLGLLAGRPGRQGQDNRKATGKKSQDDGYGLACRHRRSEPACDPARAEAWDRTNLEEVSLP
jgi:Carbohydrate esterase, sialic acid-specific acetylesterase